MRKGVINDGWWWVPPSSAERHREETTREPTPLLNSATGGGDQTSMNWSHRMWSGRVGCSICVIGAMTHLPDCVATFSVPSSI